MKNIQTKLLITAGSALAGLIIYDVSMRIVETFHWIADRHPTMGFGGWLLFGLWALGAAVVGMVGDRLWKDRKLFVQGDVPIALMLFYMTVSGLIYMLAYGA